MSDSQRFDKQAVSHSFSKAAASYDQHAFLQREIGDRLFERLDLMTLSPNCVLDVGCGTGHYTRLLKKKYPKARVTGVDIAPGMIEQARAKKTWFNRCDFILGDMDQLPFDDHSVDLIFSNLALQWSVDSSVSFAELNRVLKPGGLLIFSTLGPDTLCELRQAWQQVDNCVHVNPFTDMHDLGDDLLRAGLLDPVMDMEHIRLTYQTLSGLFADLKGIGAHNLNHGRHTGLMSKSRWRAMTQAYDLQRTGDALYPVTYEVVYGHGWGKPTQSDVYQVSLPANSTRE